MITTTTCLGKTRRRACTNSPISGKLLCLNCEQSDKRLTFLANNPNTPPEVLDDIARNYPPLEVLCAIARNTATSQTTLKRLCYDEPRVRRALVSNSNAWNVEIVQELNGPENAFIRRVLANQARLPQSVVAELVKDDDATVRRAVIQNQSVDDAQLMDIVEDSSVLVRTALTSMYYLPAKVTERLLRSECADTRNAAAKRHDVTQEQLSEMLRRTGRDGEALAAIASNPSAGPVLLRKIAARLQPDEDRAWLAIFANPYADSQTMMRYLQSSPQKSEEGSTQSIIEETIAAHRNATDQVQLRLWNRSNPLSVQLAIANNPSTTPHVLGLMADTLQQELQLTIAQRTDCPPLQLHRLATQTSTRVKRYALSNPSLPVDTLRSFLLGSSNKLHSETMLWEKILRLPHVPDDVLTLLSLSKTVFVARSAARVIKQRAESAATNGQSSL